MDARTYQSDPFRLRFEPVLERDYVHLARARAYAVGLRGTIVGGIILGFFLTAQRFMAPEGLPTLAASAPHLARIFAPLTLIFAATVIFRRFRRISAYASPLYWGLAIYGAFLCVNTCSCSVTRASTWPP